MIGANGVCDVVVLNCALKTRMNGISQSEGDLSVCIANDSDDLTLLLLDGRLSMLLQMLLLPAAFAATVA